MIASLSRNNNNAQTIRERSVQIFCLANTVSLKL